VKYSIVWVRLDNSFDCTEIPYFSDWDKPGMQTIVADSYLWNTVAERRWENFTDFSHFAFVHPGTLYDPFFASHPAVQVNRIDGELQFKLAPPREMEGIPEEAPMGRLRLPMHDAVRDQPRDQALEGQLTVRVVDNSVPSGRQDLPQLHDHRSRDRWSAGPHAPCVQKRVLEEDQPVIQSQWPAEISAGEISVATDKVSIQYRKWHRELCQAALRGKEEFQQYCDPTSSTSRRLCSQKHPKKEFQ
jgi:vanillate O-demethylase monooxygenase subunit